MIDKPRQGIWVNESLARKGAALVDAPNIVTEHIYVPCSFPEPCTTQCHCSRYCFYDPSEREEEAAE